MANGTNKEVVQLQITLQLLRLDVVVGDHGEEDLVLGVFLDERVVRLALLRVLHVRFIQLGELLLATVTLFGPPLHLVIIRV